MIVLWVPPFILDRIKNPVPGVCKWEPAHNPEFVVVIAVLGHHGSCFVLLFCYVRVACLLRKRSKIKIGNRASYSKAGIPTASTTNQPDESYVRNDERSEVDCDKKIQDDSESIWNTYNSKKVFRSGARAQVAPLKEPVPLRFMEPSVGNELEHQNQKGKIFMESYASKYEYERREAKVVKTLRYIIFGYIFCWVPFHIVFDISAIAPDIVPEAVYTATFWLTYLNSAINPILYNFSSSEFKQAFKNIVFSCSSR